VTLYTKEFNLVPNRIRIRFVLGIALGLTSCQNKSSELPKLSSVFIWKEGTFDQGVD